LTTTQQYELNPTLILLADNDGDSWQIESSTTRPRYAVDDPRVIRVLSMCASLPPSPLSAFESLLRRETGSAELVRDLVEREILTATSQRPDVELPPATNQFHYGTRNHPFLYMRSLGAIVRDNLRMQQYEREASPPPAQLVLDYLDEVRLTSLHGDVPAVSDDSRAHSLLGVGSELHDRVSTIFDGVFGIRAVFEERWDQWQDGTRMYQYETLSKGVPSGGGMHPTECFGLARGAGDRDWLSFHYCAPHNSLGILQTSIDHPDATSRAGAVVDLFVISRLERAMWRYRDSRSARAVVLDAGHVMGLLAQLSEALGLGFDVTTDLDDDAVRDLFGLPPMFQPMFVARIGF
jgi:hypothetical protein